MVIVADTSSLVSLSCGSGVPLFDLLEAEYDVVLPAVVVAELEDVASYDDEQARAARTALEWANDVEVEAVSLDATFPLDDGQNAAVTLANDREASMLLCDEFNRIGRVHASLDAGVRIATTPTLLLVLVERDRLSPSAVESLLDEIAALRSWDESSYVDRVRDRLSP